MVFGLILHDLVIFGGEIPQKGWLQCQVNFFIYFFVIWDKKFQITYVLENYREKAVKIWNL